MNTQSIRQIQSLVILTALLFISSTTVAQKTCGQLLAETSRSLPFDLTNTDPEAIPDIKALGFQPTISESIAFANEWIVFAGDPLRPHLSVANFPFKLEEGGHYLKIGYVLVAEEFRRKGISEAMFARVLKEHPQIKVVESLLDFTNAELIQKMQDEGLSLEEAIRRSPAGRMRARFNFTKVIDYHLENNKVHLIVSKP